MNKELKQNTKRVLRKVLPRYIINRYSLFKLFFKVKDAVQHYSKPYVKGKRPMGINLYGDFELGTGLSRSVNLLRDDMECANVPYSVHQVEEFSGIPAEEKKEQADYAINVFHIQPYYIPFLFDNIPQSARDEHYNIAHWAWETPDIPKEWIPLCDMFDEIWTPSAFVAKALRKVTNKPIKVYPHAVYQEKNIDTTEFRNKYSIPPQAFLCLAMFDGLSGTERKNPDAAIRVFKNAFSDAPDDAFLLVKAKNSSGADARHLTKLLGDTKNVVHIEGKLSFEETDEILASVDALISLHRAEGFGLPVAEVMQYGGVVLSTDYSATKEFVNEQNGCPVKCKLVRTKKDYGVYRAGTIWAAPDEEDAALKLRAIYDDPVLRKRIGENARKTIRDQLSKEKIGKRIAARVKAICGADI